MPFPRPGKGELQKLVLCSLKQPMTAKQLSKITNLSINQCSSAVYELAKSGLTECKNPAQRRSRIFFLTERGKIALINNNGHTPQLCNFPSDEQLWSNYGFICFSHRSAIIKTLPSKNCTAIKPMNAATIKRRAKFNNSELRMSANNVRDALKDLVARGIVNKSYARRDRYPHYYLSDSGEYFKKLLSKAD
jgi:DNA-binding transcriptional regulator GbsR (MarR family)